MYLCQLLLRENVSLREKGVDLNKGKTQPRCCPIVSLREKGVDLNRKKTLNHIHIRVSLREKGVDLNVKAIKVQQDYAGLPS